MHKLYKEQCGEKIFLKSHRITFIRKRLTKSLTTPNKPSNDTCDICYSFPKALGNAKTEAEKRKFKTNKKHDHQRKAQLRYDLKTFEKLLAKWTCTCTIFDDKSNKTYSCM